tara:strand:+ start:634 stop:2142 length:1509 start_codon:yes stop_codon:yes gene_type:complete
MRIGWDPAVVAAHVVSLWVRTLVTLFDAYVPTSAYDELFASASQAHPETERVVQLLSQVEKGDFKQRQRLADAAFRRGGVTFSVYSDRRGVEKTFPFDLIPRIISGRDWRAVEKGLIQRVTALNRFLEDIYGDQEILRAGKIPRELIEQCSGYVPQVRGLAKPHGVAVHVAGVDLLRRDDGEFVVLEDNLRVPSGVSYVLENRSVMKRLFPNIFQMARVEGVDDYAMRLADALRSVSPVEPCETNIAVLTPGVFNSAYFEHSFLARLMGCQLVEGRDLFVHDDCVWVKTTRGPERVHVIYRRVDDLFLDPDVFHEDSVLGVAGLMRAYASGNVTIANAVGNGVADDKAVYPYVPEMVRFYLDEEPSLQQVKTYLCSEEADRRYVLEHLPELVVKEVASAGGYGMTVGPMASKAELQATKERVSADPSNYIAQPVVEFSTCPTWSGRKVAPRRVDMRPYIITGKSSWVLPGGLTRVALTEGSYVVNSSQGGGSKDTWVLKDPS